MSEKNLSIGSINRRNLCSSSSSPNLTYEIKYSTLNNFQKRNSDYKAKKIIEKYTSKNYKNKYLYDDNLTFDHITKDKNNSYKIYFYEEGDNFDILKKKNKNLKRLFEEANCSLILSLKNQEKMEEKYENEKKEILERLSKIQNKYEIYAENYQKANIYKDKLNEITTSYEQLLGLYLKLDCEFKKYKDKITKIYNNINNFIENNCENDSANIQSFEYILHIKKEINDKFNVDEKDKTKNSKFIKNINGDKKIFRNKLHSYYTTKYHNNDFTKTNNKINSTLDKTKNFSLINKKKKEPLIKDKNNNALNSAISFIKKKFIDIDEL